MIRTLAFAALVIATASPALAYEAHQRAVPPEVQGRFSNFHVVDRLMSDSTSETYRMRDTLPDARGATVVYDVTKGKGADRVNVNSSSENPFMAGPERISKPAQ